MNAPESSSRHLYAGHQPTSKQVTVGLLPERAKVSGFDDTFPLRRFYDGSLVFVFLILT